MTDPLEELSARFAAEVEGTLTGVPARDVPVVAARALRELGWTVTAPPADAGPAVAAFARW